MRCYSRYQHYTVQPSNGGNIRFDNDGGDFELDKEGEEESQQGQGGATEVNAGKLVRSCFVLVPTRTFVVRHLVQFLYEEHFFHKATGKLLRSCFVWVPTRTFFAHHSVQFLCGEHFFSQSNR